jgi:hypothetical protein
VDGNSVMRSPCFGPDKGDECHNIIERVGERPAGQGKDGQPIHELGLGLRVPTGARGDQSALCLGDLLVRDGRVAGLLEQAYAPGRIGHDLVERFRSLPALFQSAFGIERLASELASVAAQQVLRGRGWPALLLVFLRPAGEQGVVVRKVAGIQRPGVV